MSSDRRWTGGTANREWCSVRDVEDLRHWSDRCWCEQEHAEGTAGLVPPPWATETGEGGGRG